MASTNTSSMCLPTENSIQRTYYSFHMSRHPGWGIVIRPFIGLPSSPKNRLFKISLNYQLLRLVFTILVLNSHHHHYNLSAHVAATFLVMFVFIKPPPILSLQSECHFYSIVVVVRLVIDSWSHKFCSDR